jgi:hypothetical protein
LSFSASLFYIGEFFQKAKILFKKIDFGGFQSSKVRKNKNKNGQISLLGFQCVARNIEARLNIFSFIARCG